MSDREHLAEGLLLIQARKIIVAIDHALEFGFIEHGSTAKELEQRKNELRSALFAYEALMLERNG